MPLFDFACKKCGEVFEYTRAFGSKENPKCAKCGSKRTEKILTPPAIHFKGGGFYKTDASARKPATPPARRSPEQSEGEGGKKAKPKEEKKEPPKSPPPEASRAA